MSKVTIIGGGIIGLCCAWYLREKGQEVSVIERGDFSKGTSFGNAGYVSPSHFTPLASPGIVAKGLRWMLRSDSPFFIKPRFDTELLRWGWLFRQQANRRTMERNMVPLNELLQLSRSLQSELLATLGNHFRMEEKGCLMLYKNSNTEKHELELAEKANRFNIATVVLDAAGVQQLEPEVEVSVRGGVLYPIDAHLHPGEFMLTLANALRSHGVTLLSNTETTGFETRQGKVTGIITVNGKISTDTLILANGAWLSSTARQLGISLVMQAGKGYSMTFEQPERNLRYPAILVDDRVAMTPLGADLRMGGTMEISGLNSPLLYHRAKAIFKAAKKYYPDLPVEMLPEEKVWFGFRPLSPDGLPYIGRSARYDNVLIAGGHAMLGVSLAAATGLLISEMAGHIPTTINVDAFAPERFV